MKKQTRIIVQVVLGIISVVLAFLIFESIMAPVRFNKEKDRRSEVVIQRLKDIRTVQIAFKSSFGKYIGTMDSLELFLKEGKLPVIKKIGNVPDTLTEAEALKMKIISRDTSYEVAYDVLFPKQENKDKHIKGLRWIPFTNHTKEIIMSAGTKEKGGFYVPVFEAKVPFEDYLNGLNEQEILNISVRAKDLARFPGLKVGSLDDAITEGNWE